jgi:hypothetical protein
MVDRIINSTQARELHAEISPTRVLLGWVVMRDQLQYGRDKFIARLVTDRESSCVLVANTLDEIRAQLPPRLVRMEPQSAHPQDVVEFWVPSSTGGTSTGDFEHAMSLLTAMSTATQLFVGLTGAVWAVLVPNTMALPLLVVALALFLHALLGTVMFLVLRGLGANMVQRLNLGRWKEQYGDKEGIGDAAWFGVPPLRHGIKAARPFRHPSTWLKAGLPHDIKRIHRVVCPSTWFKARIPDRLQTQIDNWTGKTGGQSIDRSYAIPRYPTLRIQRTAWPFVPLFGAACSLYLGVNALGENRNMRKFVVAELHYCSKQVRLST